MAHTRANTTPSILSLAERVNTSENMHGPGSRTSTIDPTRHGSGPGSRTSIIEDNFERFIQRMKGKATFVQEHGSDPEWTSWRRYVAEFIGMRSVDMMLSIAVLANIALLVIETDREAQEEEVAEWVRYANRGLLVIYTIELALRIFVYRRLFFFLGLNWLDLLVVCGDVLIEILSHILGGDDQLPSVVILRAFKLTRLTRSRRVLRLFPELYLMVIGLGAALKAIFWGMLLLVIVLILWGILAVQIIHPLGKSVQDSGGFGQCERCSRAFETVPASFLTFMQHIIAGDSWGKVTIPIVEAFPASILFFFGVISTVAMVVMNLILGVVVDGATEARKKTDHEFAREKEKEFERAKKILLQVCSRLDDDNSGSLSLRELTRGYEDDVSFQDTMKCLDLSLEDMGAVFSILDDDNSGSVSYLEFVDQLYKLRNHDSHTLLVFIKYFVTELRHEMKEEIQHTGTIVKDIKGILTGVADLEAQALKGTQLSAREHEILAGIGQETILDKEAEQGEIVSLNQPAAAVSSNGTQWTIGQLGDALHEVLACVQRNERFLTSKEFAHTASKIIANESLLDHALHVAGPYTGLPRLPPSAPQKKRATTPPPPADILCSGCVRLAKHKGNGPCDAPEQRIVVT